MAETTNQSELEESKGDIIADRSGVCDAFEMLEDIHDGELLAGIHSCGLEQPTVIQQRTIIPIMNGRDVAAQAQSGSGKTAAFLIGSLCRIDPRLRYPQVVVIANTRELAAQIHSVAVSLSQYMSISIELCVGDHKRSEDNLRDAQGSHMLIGTPGRLRDLCHRDPDLLRDMRIFILDEADTLLSGTFIDAITAIAKSSRNKSYQICTFSATYVHENLDTIDSVMTDPVVVLIDPIDVVVESIKNYVCLVSGDAEKIDSIVDIFSKINYPQVMIFVNLIERADTLQAELSKHNIITGVIHSALTPDERQSVVKLFRNSRIRALITTGLLERGIDVQGVGVVINYDVPDSPENYIHRVGRCGRFGRAGAAITFVCTGATPTHERRRNGRRNQESGQLDRMKLENIVDTYKIRFEDLPNTFAA